MQKVIFITGTDTGVGKTILTALLLSHLRQTGCPVLALKPFCSGRRADAELLYSLQNGDLTLDEVNPFHFAEPLTPLIAARKHNRQIPIGDVLLHIRSVIPCLSSIENRKSKIKTPTLLVEGAGGLLAPLGEPNSRRQFKVQDSKLSLRNPDSDSGFEVQSSMYSAVDLITALNSHVILVSPNRLGTINHTLLTIAALKSQKIQEIKVVLMDGHSSSLSRNRQHATRSNPSILIELLSPIPLFHIPNLGKNPSKPGLIYKSARIFKKTLAQILA